MTRSQLVLQSASRDQWYHRGEGDAHGGREVLVFPEEPSWDIHKACLRGMVDKIVSVRCSMYGNHADGLTRRKSTHL